MPEACARLLDLQCTGEATRARAEELSLVSSQILRKAVKPDGKAEVEKATPATKKDKFGGFNPYDNN